MMSRLVIRWAALLCLLFAILLTVLVLKPELPADVLAFSPDRTNSFDIYLYNLAMRLTINISRTPVDDFASIWNAVASASTIAGIESRRRLLRISRRGWHECTGNT